MGVWCHQFFLMRKARVRSCLPRGGWDHRRYGQRPAPRILIPHSMGGGQFARLPPCDNINISIHPPRGGVGPSWTMCKSMHSRFQSPHSVGGDWSIHWLQAPGSQFQSTHPVGGGTWAASQASAGIGYFNPPTPWGVGLRYRP